LLVKQNIKNTKIYNKNTKIEKEWNLIPFKKNAVFNFMVGDYTVCQSGLSELYGGFRFPGQPSGCMVQELHNYISLPASSPGLCVPPNYATARDIAEKSLYHLDIEKSA